MKQNILKYSYNGRDYCNILVSQVEDKYYINIESSLVSQLGLRNFYSDKSKYMVLDKENFDNFTAKLLDASVTLQKTPKMKIENLNSLKTLLKLDNLKERSKGTHKKRLPDNIVSMIKDINDKDKN